MESFEKFLEIFERCRETKIDSELVGVLKDSRRYFQNISTNELGLVLSRLLDEERGLLQFLQDEVKEISKVFTNSLSEGFRLLEFIIEQFHGYIRPYVTEIQKTCELALETNCSHYTRSAATSAFKTLIRLFSMELDLERTVKEFINKDRYLDDKQRTHVLKIFGTISKCRPEAISPNHNDYIFKRIMTDFNVQYKKSGNTQSCLTVYLEVLTDMISRFPLPTESEEFHQYYKTLYTCIKDLSRHFNDNKRKVNNRVAIGLLQKHMSLFAEWVYDEHTYWHNTFHDWLRQRGVNSTTGFDALVAFYETVGTILEDRNSESDRKIFEHYMNHFKKSLMENEMDSKSLRLVIRGIGTFAGCQNFSTENHISELFSVIAQKTSIIYSREDETLTSLEDIAYFQVAMSLIMAQMPNTTTDQLSVLTTLSAFLVKRFPDLPLTSHSLIVTSLLDTIDNIRQIRRTLYQEFVQKLVYEGILWTCSHTLLIDAELQREIQDLEERPVCYKNYLPLWQQLLNSNRTRKVQQNQLLQSVFNEMMSTCITLINKLNLNTKTKDENVFSDVGASQVAVNDDDFRIFVNLVDLFVDIFAKLEPTLIESWIQKFVYVVVKNSYRNPLISGFYKLLHSVLKIYGVFHDLEKREAHRDTVELVSQYLSETLDRVCSFSGELQISCLQLILDAPVFIVRNMLNRMAPVLITAFAIGQSNFDIAQSAIGALESWSRTLEKEDMNNFLIEVVPALEPFLQSTESATELRQEILKTERKVIKRATVTDHEKTLEALQAKILLFLGSLDTEILLNFVHKRSLNTGASWDEKNLLEYIMPYKDSKPKIYLDKILPRVIELAMSSSDRRTRVVACEVLHSIVIIMLGRSLQLIALNPDLFTPIFKKLCPALLKLGCDSDQVIQQLFFPLMIQMTHWLSSRLMLKSSNTVILIETLFESLTDESNSALRGFSGTCLAQFVTWSIKQSTDGELQRSPTNILAIVRKITSFALHPSTNKRIGAAIAFNHLYTILRENDIIVDTFWLELLFAFVKSLDGCGSTHILNALSHVQKVLTAKSELFNRPSTRRRKPVEFEGTLSKDAAQWLLLQCCSLDPNCRKKSMEMLRIFSPNDVMLAYLRTNGLDNFNQVMLKGLHQKMVILSEENLEAMLRTLDCYVWLLEEQLMSFELLLTDENPCKDVVFDNCTNFVHLFLNLKGVKKEDNQKIPEEIEKVTTLKCKVILRIFDFIQLLLNSTEVERNGITRPWIPDSFLNVEIFSVISACIMKPHKLGFNVRNLEIMESLPSSIEKLLNTLKVKLDNNHILMLKAALSEEIQSDYEDFVDLKEIVVNGANAELGSYLNGIILLKKCDLLDKFVMESWTDENTDKKVTEIFDGLKKQQFRKDFCFSLTPDTKKYLDNMMDFLLLKCKPKVVKTLVNLSATQTPLCQQGSSDISHGDYFFLLFKGAIFRNMLRNIPETIETLLNEKFQGNPDIVLTIMEELVKYVLKHRRDSGEHSIVLQKELVKTFSSIQKMINDSIDRKRIVLSLYAHLVRLMENPSDICREQSVFFYWILGELSGYSDLAYKTYILRNFLACLVDLSSEENHKLTDCLNKLKTDHYPASLGKNPSNNLERSNVIVCFQTLLVLLPITKSVVVFEFAINFAAGDVTHLCNESVMKYLEAYFNVITNEYAVKSLQASFERFMNTETLAVRLDVLQRFLLPAFEFCKPPVIEKFYEQNIKVIYTIILQSLTGSDMDIRKLMVSKIGCNNLVEVMFARVPLDKIDNVESQITRNAVGEVKTGRELLLPLFRSTINVRKLRTSNPENAEVMRLLHCAAYNCCVAIFSSKQDKLYRYLLGENSSKNQLIWDNVVDLERRYEFPQELQELPKIQTKLVNIRNHCKKSHDQIPSQRYSYIQSYNLASSTLNEDLGAYDLHNTTLLSQSVSKNNDREEMMSLTFESDDLNDHECMASICGVLNYMVSIEMFRPPEGGDHLLMPDWITYFHSSISCTKYHNVQMFLLKVIFNTQNVFKPYAKFFLTPILKIIYEHIRFYCAIDYVTTDILVMLIDWHTVAIPSEDEDRISAQKLLRMLILSTCETKQPNVYKYYMELIKTLVKVWQPCLDSPHQYLQVILKHPNKENLGSCKIQLILILLSNNMERELLSEGEIVERLKTNLGDWKKLNEETLLHVCEALGVVLKYFTSNNELQEKELSDNVNAVFRHMRLENADRLTTCIYAMHKHYPYITSIWFLHVTSSVWTGDASHRPKCLEMFLADIPTMTDERVKEGICLIEIQKMVQNKISSCEKVALRIIEKLITVLKPSELLPLASLVPPYAKDVSLEYREIAYSIFMNVYNKYCEDIMEDEAVDKLKDLSKRVLLIGLLDTNDGLQQKLLKFWTEDRNLTENSSERLLTILEMYDPAIESTYLPICPLMMLQLASTAPEFRAQTKIFPPLSNCTFEDYRVAVLWRAKNAGSMAPLFTPSLASQLNQSFTQLSQSGSQWNQSFDQSNRSFTHRHFELRATASPGFEPTVREESALPELHGRIPWSDDDFKVPKIPQPASNRKSKRFLKSSVDVSESMRYREIKKNLHRDEMLKEEVVRQRSTVKMTRKYRIGDFPDTEITHSEVIVPLQELAKKDQLIAKDLTVSLFCSLANDLSLLKKSEFLKKASSSLKFILDNNQGTSPIVATALEIILESREIDVSPNTVAKVSKASGLLSLGALLLEEKLIRGSMAEDEEPSSKKSKMNNKIDNDQNMWVQLASLYESMREVDVVLSIFGNKVDGDALQEASVAQAASDWKEASRAYEDAYNINERPIREHCLEGLYTCLAHLSSWDKIDEHIRTMVNDDFNAIWDPSWRDDSSIVPWIFKVQLELKLRNENSEKFTDALSDWLGDETKLADIKGNFGEELSMFFISHNPEVALDFLTSGLEVIRQQWVHLNPLSAKLRASKLFKLRGFYDIQTYLETVKDKRYILPRAKKMMQYWSRSVPSNKDDLLLWETHIAYRTYFARLLLSQMQDLKINEDDAVSSKVMHFAPFEQCLKLVETALNQGNRYFAKKHLVRLDKEINDGPQELQNKLLLGVSRFKYLCAEVKQEMLHYTVSWRKSHELVRMANLEPEVESGIRQHISVLASRLGKLAMENESFANTLMKTDEILKDISATKNREHIVKQLNSYSLKNLKECYKISDTANIADCYLKVSKYCHLLISDSKPDPELSREFVDSTLSAMAYGSVEATQYFACLLQLEHLQSVEVVRQTFERQCEKVETWMFLSWQAQLFSYIDTPVKSLVIPILVRLAETYPNALVYTFRLKMEMNPKTLADDDRLKRILLDKPEVDAFLKAMQYVVQPELYLQQSIKQLAKNMALGRAKAVGILMSNVYPTNIRNKDLPVQGRVYKEIASYQEKLKAIEFEEKVDDCLKVVMQDLKIAIETKEPKKFSRLLKDYSPWLHYFSGGELEVPGQYPGDRKPMPRYHARIMKFDPAVSVMCSLRRPIKITMLGNDAKSYSFLVKFGEDLRVDQRIEQLFTLMNKVLHTDTTSRQRHLSIDNYQVIPLTSCLGLIQWVEHTRSLDDFIHGAVPPERRKQYEDIKSNYLEYINRAAPSYKNISEKYKAVVMSYSRQDVTRKFNVLKSIVEWHLLRDSFKRLSSSPESFIALRHNFVTSYATMCIAQWILGIGDRHLSNTLISTDSGRSLGIDFGLVFGAGTGQAIPELMPCRITPQILGLLQPFDENGLLRATMTHVLRALRNGKEPLLACMEVFIREPSLDWLAKAKSLSDAEHRAGQAADRKRNLKTRISLAKDMLTGANPSAVVLKELKNHRGISLEEFPRYETIVRGQDIDSIRSRAEDANLSPDEQVECLLEQATDPNILGRTYHGWRPWM